MAADEVPTSLAASVILFDVIARRWNVTEPDDEYGIIFIALNIISIRQDISSLYRARRTEMPQIERRHDIIFIL